MNYQRRSKITFWIVQAILLIIGFAASKLTSMWMRGAL